MKVEIPGHVYNLSHLDDEEGKNQQLVFVCRTGPEYPGNENAFPGTTTQEVLRALIERAQYLNTQKPCIETALSIWLFRLVIFLYEFRHARKKGYLLRRSLRNIEKVPCSPVDLHLVREK